MRTTAAIYADLARDARLLENGASDDEGGRTVDRHPVGHGGSDAGLPTSITGCGVTSEDLPALAEEAAQQWTGTFNPRPVGRDELLGLYEGACG